MKSKLSTPTENERWIKMVKHGDTETRISVEALENIGFLIIVEKSGYKGKGRNREWFSCEKKYYSPSNPFDKEKDDPFDDLAKMLIE